MPFDSSLSKSKGQVVLEYVLLAFCLCVIALRSTYTEGPPAQTITPVNLNDNLYTLSVSAVLFLSFALWFIYGFFSKRFLYRFTAVEIGLCLFCLAAVIAGFTASNKRAAITYSLCLIAPVLMAVLLVQILDSQDKIKLVLAVIAALGAVSAYQCAEQFFVGNQLAIDQYEQNPQTTLEPFGIEPGSLQQFLFEHRLYSGDVKGFFTTGNSAGSFAILASFAAVALFIDKFQNRRSRSSTTLSLIACGVAVVAIVFGLIITHSKGAIVAFLIATVMFVAFISFGNWLRLHKKAILLVCLLFFIAAAFAIAAYGLTYNRLPGGNSMLVRWQYWYASAKMYADHALTGVGPGNFAHFYTHYKPAAAAESIADPHNFLLSVLTQYGPLGLVGFLALLFLPLWKSFPSRTDFSTQLQSQPNFKSLVTIYLIIISAALLFIRPLIMRIPIGDTFEVALYVIFTLYVAPVAAFFVGVFLLTSDNQIRAIGHQSKGTYISAALFCAVIGLLLHNLIDFSIFEPPVFTAFCAILACLIALDFQQNSRRMFIIKPPFPVRITIVGAGLLLIWDYFNYALVPVAKTTICIKRAVRQEQQFGEYDHKILNYAAEKDRLDPTSLNLNGKLYLQHFNKKLTPQLDLLKKAEACFLAAIARDKSDFKNYEKLGDVCILLAKNSPEQEKNDWLNYAIDHLWSAVEYYPGSSDLRIKLAEVAEHLGKTDVAIAQYEKAVEIEDAYRNQFKIMYPQCKIFSRLGEEKYNHAKQQIKMLSEKPTP
jgi:hypothetical protein